MSSGSPSGDRSQRIIENIERRKKAGIGKKPNSKKRDEERIKAAKTFDSNFGKGGGDAGF